VFIGKYQEVMRDIKERYRQEQFKHSSYAAILAKHQQRINMQNQQNATISSPRKTKKKNYGRGFDD